MSSSTMSKTSIMDVKEYLESSLNDDVLTMELMDIIVSFAKANHLIFETSRDLVFKTIDAQLIEMNGAYQISLVK